MTAPKPDYLECDHCGDVAVESPDGLFRDGDGDACMTCGHPGHVSVDDDGACWSVSDEGRCKVAECVWCADRGES